jgi:hypothetical protein
MRPRWLHVVSAVLVGIGSPLPTHAQAGDPGMEKGIRQAQEGDFQQAIVTLQGVLPRLLERKAPLHDIARVHVYLGVSHLGLKDPAAARASFLEAIRIDPTLILSSEEYPPRIVRAFEEARLSAPPPAAAASAAEPAAPSTPPASPPAVSAPPSSKAEPAAAKKGGSKLPLVLVGVGVVGGGVALAAGGGGGGSSTSPSASTPTVTTPPAPMGNVNLVSSAPPTGGLVMLPGDQKAGTPIPEVVFEVTYGADVAEPWFEINLWRGPDLCFSTSKAYAQRLDGPDVPYTAGTTARYVVNWWTARQPGCGESFLTDRFEFFWGRASLSLFTQNLSLGWDFGR